MGVKRKNTPGPGTPGPGSNGAGSPGSKPTETLPTGLAALLASEDLLFRDPFADFTPSAR